MIPFVPRHFVYRHFGASGELLYVGMTCHPRQRWRGHKGSPWFRDISRVEYQEHQGRDEALDAETAAILFEKPKFNKRYNLTRATKIFGSGMAVASPKVDA